jgi:hypothetical protein
MGKRFCCGEHSPERNGDVFENLTRNAAEIQRSWQHRRLQIGGRGQGVSLFLAGNGERDPALTEI